MDELEAKIAMLGERLDNASHRVSELERRRDDWRDEVRSLLSEIDSRVRTVEKIVWVGIGICAVLQLISKKLL